MNNTLKIQLHQEAKKMVGTGRGKLFESALERQQSEVAARAVEWVSLSDKKPDVLEVRVKLTDGSEVNCWAQSDGDFYWKGGGSEVFICEHTVTHWMPQPPKEKGHE